jgi:chromosome segregation ATPase
MIEILVLCRGGRSTISFDALPTFAKFRNAVATDVVGTDTFQMVGTTQRGTTIVIKDQPSFIRALGPRNELTVQIREQLESVPTSGVFTPAASERSATPSGLASAPVLSRRPTDSPLAPPVVATSSAASLHTAQRTTSPSPPRGRRSPGPSAPGSFVDAPSKHGITCHGALDNSGDARCSAFVKATNTVWTGERDTGTIVVHDAARGTAVRSIAPFHNLHSPQVGCLSIVHVPSHRITGGAGTIWAGFNNKQIKVFDAATMQEVKTIVEHSGAITALEHVGGYVFSASVDFTILQWNSDTYAKTRLLARHRNGVRALCAGPMQRLVSSSDDRSIIVWHAQTGEVNAEIENAHPCGVHALAYHRRRLWTGDERGAVKAWGVTAGPGNDAGGALGSIALSCLSQTAAHGGAVTCIRGFNDRVITAGQDRSIHIFDADSGSSLGQVLHPHDSPVSTIAVVSAMQVFRFWTGGLDHKWCQWTLEAALPADAGNGAMTTYPGTPAPQNIDPSRSATPMFTAAAASTRGHSEADREHEHRLAATRIEIEQAAERAHVAVAEAKERAELALIVERVRRERFFTAHAVAAAHVADFALRAHANFGAWCLDQFAQSCALIRKHVDAATAAAVAHDAVLHQHTANHEKHRREAEKARSLLQQQLQAAHEELLSTHDEFEAAVEERDALTAKLRDAESRAAGLSEELRQSREEQKTAQKRQSHLEQLLSQAHEDNATHRRTHEHTLAQQEADWQRRMDELSARNHALQERLDAVERDERRRRAELSSERETTESLQKRLQQAADLAKQLDEQRTESIERDRAMWHRQVHDAETEVRDLKARLEGTATESSAEIARLTGELRELRIRHRQLQDDNAATNRRLQSHQHESGAEVAALSEQLEEVRSTWRGEVDSIEAALSDKTAKLAAAEAALRERESTLSAVKASMQLLHHKHEVVTAEMARIKDSHASDTSDLEARLRASEDTVSTLKADLAASDGALVVERSGRNEAELRLSALEESYEALRRRSADELGTLKEVHQRESGAIAARYKTLCEELESTRRDLHTELDAVKMQLVAQEHAYSTLHADYKAAQETSDFATRKCSHLSTQLAEAEGRHKDEDAQLRRALELRRKELEELQHTSASELERLRDEIAHRVAAEEELADAVRAVDGRFAQCRNELESERRKNADLSNDFRRLAERAASERKASDDRDEEVTDTVTRLRAEHSALLAKHDAVVDERDLLQRAKKDLDNANAGLKDEVARLAQRHAAMLHEREIVIEQLRNEAREHERQLGQLRSRQHELESDLQTLKRQHAVDVEDKRRQHRAELDDVRDVKERIDHQLKRVQAQLATLKEEHDAACTAAERKQQELEAILAENSTTMSQLQAELQDAKAAAVAERERNAREVKQLRDAAEEHATRSHAERRRYEAAVEERRLADKRFNDAMEQHKSSSTRETEALHAALASQRLKAAEAQTEAAAQIKHLSAELQRLKDELDRSKLMVDEKDKAIQLAERDGDHRAAMLSGEGDALRRQLLNAQTEAHDMQHRLEREVETHRDALARERSEAAELSSTARQLEAQLAAVRLEAEREARKASDVTSELRRTQDRSLTEKEQTEARYRELTVNFDRVQAENSRLMESVSEKSLEVMKMETTSRDAAERQRQLNEQIDTWKRRTQEAQVAKEKAVADATIVRASLEAQHVDEANAAHDAQRRLQSELHDTSLRADDLDRENTRLRRTMLDVQTENEELMRRSMELSTVSEHRFSSVQDEKQELTSRLSAAMEERRRAIHLANEHEAECKTLRRQLAESEHRAESEAAAKEHAAATYAHVIAGIEDDCAALRSTLSEILEQKERAVELLSLAARDRMLYEESLQQSMRLLDVATAAVDAKKTLVDDVVGSFNATVASIHAQWHRRAASSEGRSDAVAEEVQRLTVDLQVARNERDLHRAARLQSDEVLEEVREEIQSLYAKYKEECTAHDKTRMQLAGLRGTGVTVKNEAATVHLREEELRLRGKIQALEADRDAAVARCAALHAELAEAKRTTAAGVDSNKHYISPANRIATTTTGGNTMESFILRTRADLVAHIRELAEGLSEACRLMQGLNRVPMVVPDEDTLACVYGWLSSARTRGDLIQRTLFTDGERRG